MTSRHLYFKLLLEDLKRKTWAAALEGLALFFALPVALAMTLSNITNELYGDMTLVRGQAQARTMLEFGNDYPVIMLILGIAAVVMGISAFSYLQNRRQVDFYHSLPVKRELQFAVHVTGGILITAAVYLAAQVIAIAVAAAGGVLSREVLQAAVKGYLFHMLYYALFYMVTILAVMFTGTRIASVLGTAVFFGYFPAVGGLIYSLCQTYLHTYCSEVPSIWTVVLPRISPADAAIQALSEGMTAARGAGALAAIVLTGLLSLVLYWKRPSETAGKTMAFSGAAHIIKILLVIPFSLAGALFFSAMNSHLGWCVFGAVAGAVISHCVIEVIYHVDFKKLFCHEKTMAACMAVSLGLILGFRFDVFRYDSYLPDPGRIISASIDFNKDSWVSWDGGKLYEDGVPRVVQAGAVSDVDALLKIAAEGIRQTEEREAGTWDYQDSSYVTVGYTLKGGKRVFRVYRMSLEPVLAEADRIYGEDGYKKTLYPGISLPEEEAAANMVYMDYLQNVKKPEGTKEELAAVYRAYQEEMAAMTLSRQKTEAPIGQLLLISNENADILLEREEWETQSSGSRQPDYTRFWYEGFFYPIYPSFTKTIEALEGCGIQAGDWMDPAKIESVQVEYSQEIETEVHVSENGDVYYTQSSYAEPRTITYTDPDQIRKLMECFAPYSGQNQMLMLENSYSVTVTMKRQSGELQQAVNGGFPQGRVPEFIISDFASSEGSGQIK